MRCNCFPAWIIFSYLFLSGLIEVHGMWLVCHLDQCYLHLLTYLICCCFLDLTQKPYMQKQTEVQRDEFSKVNRASQGLVTRCMLPPTSHHAYWPWDLVRPFAKGHATLTVGSPVSPNWQFKAASFYTIHIESRCKMWKSRQLWTQEIPKKLRNIMKKVSLEL